MNCQVCGCELPDGSKYCHNCGSKIPELDETSSDNLVKSSIENRERPSSDEEKQTISKPIARKLIKIIGKIMKIIGIFLICLLVIIVGLLVAVVGIALSMDPDESYSQDISNAIEPTNPDVRAYALRAISKSHAGEYNIQQICDIHNKLYRDWEYVSDPGGNDYIAPASESVKLLRGDCDDYAVLMASLVEAIGGNARIVLAMNEEEEGHAYAEVCLSDFKEDAKTVLNVVKRQGGAPVHYHTDAEGNYWLNLDWTDSRPGGEFFESVGNELVIWSDGKYNRGTLISGNSITGNGKYSSTNSRESPAISNKIEPMDILVRPYA